MIQPSRIANRTPAPQQWHLCICCSEMRKSNSMKQNALGYYCRSEKDCDKRSQARRDMIASSRIGGSAAEAALRGETDRLVSDGSEAYVPWEGPTG